MKIQDSRKGKNMTAVRFAYYLNSERCLESLYDEKKSGLVSHAHIRKSKGKE